jgi:lipoprotein-releasing system ATP-binding protein
MGVILEVREIHRQFRMGEQVLDVLRGVDLTLDEGEILAIVGQSGSGKSTLLHQVGLLDKPDNGEILFRGERLPLGGPQAAHARNRYFGFVFQFYHLMPDFTALENTLMPALIMDDWLTYRRRKKQLKERARSLLERVGLTDRMSHKPPQLSGGERQRVAIARALMNAPPVLLCDEPTGNLDRKTAECVRDLLWDLNESESQSMILATHDYQLASDARRTMVLVDGRLTEHVETPS